MSKSFFVGFEWFLRNRHLPSWQVILNRRDDVMMCHGQEIDALFAFWSMHTRVIPPIARNSSEISNFELQIFMAGFHPFRGFKPRVETTRDGHSHGHSHGRRRRAWGPFGSTLRCRRTTFGMPMGFSSTMCCYKAGTVAIGKWWFFMGFDGSNTLW